MFVINISTKPSTTEYNLYSFTVESYKQMYFKIQNVYKICYNNIVRVEVINTKTNQKKVYTSKFNNIKF